MKASDIDWRVLRGALMLLGISILVCAALVYAGVHYGEIAANEMTNQRRQLISVRGEYQALDDEQKLMETYLPQYVALEDRGVIGKERRLDWIETLRAVAKEGRLTSLRYELFPQDEYTPEFPLPEGQYKVFSSGMRLDVGLLHEGDLAFLLRRLQKNSTGIFTLSKCSLRRKFSEVKIDPKAVNIDASCELRWFTVKLPQEEV